MKVISFSKDIDIDIEAPELIAALEDGKCLGVRIIAPRRSGKTRLLQRVYKDMKVKPDVFVPVKRHRAAWKEADCGFPMLITSDDVPSQKVVLIDECEFVWKDRVMELSQDESIVCVITGSPLPQHVK